MVVTRSLVHSRPVQGMVVPQGSLLLPLGVLGVAVTPGTPAAASVASTDAAPGAEGVLVEVFQPLT